MFFDFFFSLWEEIRWSVSGRGHLPLGLFRVRTSEKGPHKYTKWYWRAFANTDWNIYVQKYNYTYKYKYKYSKSFGPFVICPRMTLKNTSGDIEQHLDGYISRRIWWLWILVKDISQNYFYIIRNLHQKDQQIWRLSRYPLIWLNLPFWGLCFNVPKKASKCPLPLRGWLQYPDKSSSSLG